MTDQPIDKRKCTRYIVVPKQIGRERFLYAIMDTIHNQVVSLYHSNAYPSWQAAKDAAFVDRDGREAGWQARSPATPKP